MVVDKRFQLEGFDWESLGVLDRDRWSLIGGGHIWRFDYIIILGLQPRDKGVNTNRIFSQRIYITIQFCSQRTEMLLFLGSFDNEVIEKDHRSTEHPNLENEAL